MQSVKALRRWLVIVALLRLLAGEGCHIADQLLLFALHFPLAIRACTVSISVPRSAVFLGFFNPLKLTGNVYDKAPVQGDMHSLRWMHSRLLWRFRMCIAVLLVSQPAADLNICDCAMQPLNLLPACSQFGQCFHAACVSFAPGTHAYPLSMVSS